MTRVLFALFALVLGAAEAVASPPAIPPGAPFTATSRLRPASNQLCVIGHSMAAQAWADSTAGATRNVQVQSLSAVNWAMWRSKGRYILNPKNVFAVPGTQVKDIYNTTIASGNGAGKTQLANALASSCPIVVVWNGGHNDLPVGGAAAAGTEAGKITTGAGDDGKGMKYVLDQLTGPGKIVALIIDPPSGNSTTTNRRYSASVLKQAALIRNWYLAAATLYPGQVYPVDTWPAMQDTGASATAGDNVASYFIDGDGVHPAVAGGARIGVLLQRALDAIGGVPAVPVNVHAAGDIYDAVVNPKGNLLPNGALYGATAGMPAAQGGVSFAGVAPASTAFWATNGAAQGGTLTVTGAMVTTATGNWYQLTIAGTSGPTAGANLQYFQNLTLANLAAGDEIASAGEWEIDPASTGLQYLSLAQSAARPSGTYTSEVTQEGYTYDTVSTLDPTTLGYVGSPVEGVWCSGVSWIATGTESSASTQVRVGWKASTAINIIVRFRNLKTAKK